jgi:cysteine-rich repeat protein
MRTAIRGRLTYANVVATLALFLVLAGGTALGVNYVVSSNSQIGPNTVSGHKPPTGNHANIIGGSVNGQDLATAAVSSGKLAPNSVNGGKVADNSLSGNDIAESSLDPTVLQTRISESCDPGGTINAVAQNGTVSCSVPSFAAIEGTACNTGTYAGTAHTTFHAGVAFMVCRQVTGTPLIGNAIVENDEECDDGNAAPGDGCSATGTLEYRPG